MTHIKSMGGTPEYDIVRVVGGRGTSSEPWKVKSIHVDRIYTVSAMEIVGASYHLNYNLDDANAVYICATNKKPEESKKPNVNSLDANPF